MIVIDCGANLGQGYDRLIRQYNIVASELHMFDILPEACNYLARNYPAAKIYNKGVWNKDEIRIIKQENATLDGVVNVGHESNILQDKYTPTSSGIKHTWTTYNLECINFANFIKSNFNEIDNILVKLDIEGAEYEVMDSLIETNVIRYIKHLHIEWHPHLREDSDHLQPIDYYNNIFKFNNINLLN